MAVKYPRASRPRNAPRGDQPRELREPATPEPDGPRVCGTVKADGSTCARPADTCPYHGERS